MNKKVVIGVLVALFIVFLLGYGCVKVGSFTYSEGERTGVITKFSSKGMLYKTWEGELSQGSIEQGGKPIVWEFSVADEDIAQKVQAAQREGQRVTLAYRQQLFKQGWKGKTDYFVTDIRK